MRTLAPSSILRHTTIRVETQDPTQFIDLTDEVEALVAKAGIQTGLVNIQSLHTTAAIVVNEHEPLLLADLTGLLERVAPREAFYQHDDVSLRTVNCVPGEPANGHSHCRALLLAPAACLNVVHGRLQRGQWQRVFLVELDGPRSRDLSVLLIGEAGQ
jgi:secondary thiamine-phosphate synthase enzyme